MDFDVFHVRYDRYQSDSLGNDELGTRKRSATPQKHPTFLFFKLTGT